MYFNIYCVIGAKSLRTTGQILRNRCRYEAVAEKSVYPAHTDLSVDYFPTVGCQQMPLPAHLLLLYDRGDRGVGHFQGRVLGGKADFTVPSVERSSDVGSGAEEGGEGGLIGLGKLKFHNFYGFPPAGGDNFHDVHTVG